MQNTCTPVFLYPCRVCFAGTPMDSRQLWACRFSRRTLINYTCVQTTTHATSGCFWQHCVDVTAPERKTISQAPERKFVAQLSTLPCQEPTNKNGTSTWVPFKRANTELDTGQPKRPQKKKKKGRAANRTRQKIHGENGLVHQHPQDFTAILAL